MAPCFFVQNPRLSQEVKLVRTHLNMSPVFIVTPTYNERENLRPLAQKIFGLNIPNLIWVIVDDNSPDGTGELADQLSERYPIKVFHRNQKSGLGKAYVYAFKKILESSKADCFIIEMDGDLSHDPIVIPKMLQAVQSCDLVLGSRYIKEGKIENWNWMRRLISRFGNFYARTILGVKLRDLTGGFKCFRRQVLESIDLDSLNSAGYNFQIETTYRAIQKGFKVCEVPITFSERKSGKSKFSLGIILESFWKVLLLRFKK